MRAFPHVLYHSLPFSPSLFLLKFHQHISRFGNNLKRSTASPHEVWYGSFSALQVVNGCFLFHRLSLYLLKPSHGNDFQCLVWSGTSPAHLEQSKLRFPLIQSSENHAWVLLIYMSALFYLKLQDRNPPYRIAQTVACESNYEERVWHHFTGGTKNIYTSD